ncbi:calcium/sodium antiporter [Thermococcus thioreducens]|uniref:Cation transporter n=1 Tax=Thermococcus thioreducens TaxID=277988 RepID=A0A0Q2MRF7_9EURY|nr:calcium/sodium antiporter [Thermococcus thioreducens]ASJ12819.1 cation transporter [Thermococcus thioreducens]KQH82287.1 cation transporter [Thermococcus thioreducens]SEV84769.1 cation:H+ antiporter [Thermococcus thioreducens]
MIVEIILFALGLVLLIKGSDYFVEAASRVAKGFGVSEFLIALVLASIATTLPEVTVSAISSYQGKPDIALGNAIGSALANIALILGVSSLLRPLNVEKTAWKNSLFMIAVTAYAGLLMYDGKISRLDGASLILIYFGFLYYLYRKHMTLEELPEGGRGNPKRDALIMFGSGILVVTGAKLVVDSAVTMARAFGVPEVVIGLTMVSIGTSLPEFTNSLMATLKRLPNISVGNIIGANILDILMVIGIAALINPIYVDSTIYTFTLPLTLLVMAILTAVLRFTGRIDRLTGGVLLAIYSYFLYVYLTGGVHLPQG